MVRVAVAELTTMDLATLGLKVESGQIVKATEELGRLGDAGEDSAARTKAAWDSMGNVFQPGGFATGLRAQQEILAAMTKDAQMFAAAGRDVTSAWSRMGNPFQDGGFLTGAAAAHEISQQMIRDAAQVKSAWASIGNPFQKGGFLTGAAAAREIAAAMARDQGSVVGAFAGTERAVQRVARGFGQLAFQVTGIPGPVGKMTEALLAFGAGSAAVLGIVAGVGLIIAILDRAAKKVEESEQAAREAADAFRQLQATQAATFRGFGEEDLGGLRAREASIAASVKDLELQKQIRQGLVALAQNDAQRLAANKSVQESEAEIQRLKASQLETSQAILRIEEEIRLKKEQMVVDAEREAQLFGQNAVEAARLRGIWAGLSQQQQQRLIDATTELARRKEIVRQAELELALQRRLFDARQALVRETLRGENQNVGGQGPAGSTQLPVQPVGAPLRIPVRLELVPPNTPEALLAGLNFDPIWQEMGESFEFFFRESLANGELAFESFAQSILNTWADVAVKMAGQEFIQTALGQQLKNFIAVNRKQLAAAGLGFGIGQGTRSPIAGAAGGVAAGVALGAGPVGIAAGGIAGLVGGLLGMGKAAEIARERLREFQRSMESFRASLTPSDLDDQILGVQQRADELRKALKELGLSGSEYVKRAGEINSLEFDRIQALRAEAEALRLARIEDAEIRRIRAEGLVTEADNLAFAAQQHREMAEAIRNGADAAERAALEAAQLAEAQRRAADQARTRREAGEDLAVRLLRGQGQDQLADDLAFRFEQEREMAEAIRSGADALYLRRLAEVQYAEAQRRAAEQTATTIDDLTRAIDTIRDFQNSLKLGPLTALSPVQQLQEARRQYEQILAAAQSGDTAAAGRLPEAARAFLEASRAVNASGGRFQVDFTRVLRETEAIAQMFEGRRTEAQRTADGVDRIGQQLDDIGDWPIEPLADSAAESANHLASMSVTAEATLEVLVAAFDRLSAENADLKDEVRRLGRQIEGLGA